MKVYSPLKFSIVLKYKSGMYVENNFCKLIILIFNEQCTDL